MRRLGREGRTEWLQDWLPYGGALYESSSGAYYVGGGSGKSGAWPVGGANLLPQPAIIPTDYAATAVGNGEILIQADTDKNTTLYRIPL